MYKEERRYCIAKQITISIILAIEVIVDGVETF
jgi:hypothetical protein